MPRLLLFLSSLALLVLSLPALPASAQTHFNECVSNTGSNATLIIPAAARLTVDKQLLASGSELAVITATGICAGTTSWTGEATALTLWGDDQITPEVDGLIEGEALQLIVWDKASNTEYAQSSVTYLEGPYYSSDGRYHNNAISILEALEIAAQPVADEESPELPQQTALHPNYPNPFQTTTTLPFDLAETTTVSLVIYDLLGRKVEELVGQVLPAGRHAVRWEARGLPDGVYFSRLRVGSVMHTRKLILVR